MSKYVCTSVEMRQVEAGKSNAGTPFAICKFSPVGINPAIAGSMSQKTMVFFCRLPQAQWQSFVDQWKGIVSNPATLVIDAMEFKVPVSAHNKVDRDGVVITDRNGNAIVFHSIAVFALVDAQGHPYVDINAEAMRVFNSNSCIEVAETVASPMNPASLAADAAAAPVVDLQF